MRRLALSLCALAALAGPAAALDLNDFRAQHKKPRLSYSSTLAAMAQEQADAMAGRGAIDHKNFRQRVKGQGGTTAENVSYGCGDQDCAIAQWARSGGHRANMLRGDVSAYGLASATSVSGRKYWALMLGN